MPGWVCCVSANWHHVMCGMQGSHESSFKGESACHHQIITGRLQIPLNSHPARTALRNSVARPAPLAFPMPRRNGYVSTGACTTRMRVMLALASSWQWVASPLEAPTPLRGPQLARSLGQIQRRATALPTPALCRYTCLATIELGRTENGTFRQCPKAAAQASSRETACQCCGAPCCRTGSNGMGSTCALGGPLSCLHHTST